MWWILYIQFGWIRCYALGHPILKLQTTLLRWCLTVVCNIVGPMAKSFDNGENPTRCFKPILKCVLKLSSVAQTALGTWLSSQYILDVRGNKKRKPNKNKKDTGLCSGAVSKFPIHHRDSVSCFYQPAHFCTCSISMLSQVSFLYLQFMSVNSPNFNLTGLGC